MSLDHEPPKPRPNNHLVVVEVPADFSKVVTDSADRDGRVYSDQLLHLAQMGAECARMHGLKESHPRRRKSK